MACYTNVLITGSEYCTLHLQRPVVDDHIVKRMIKCCLNLGCNMQAAILCQVKILGIFNRLIVSPKHIPNV